MEQLQEKPQALTGVKVLLEGPAGTGKTDAIGTLVDWCAKQTPPIDVNVLFLDRGLETLIGYWTEKAPRNNMTVKPVPQNLHWRDLIVKPVSLKAMLDGAINVGKLSYDSITKLQDGSRGTNNPFEAVLNACSEFTSDRSGDEGKKWGAVDSWGADKVFVVDGLTELANACSKMVIGSKPTMAQGEYGIAQNNLMNFLRLLTQGCRCHFVLTAHVSREKDEITGGIKLMTQAIGSAISGQIPPMFSEVIYTVREGASWWWDTANANVDLKSRYLPVSSKLTPGFGQIMDKWKDRGAAAMLVPVTAR